VKSIDTNIIARWLIRDDDIQAKQVDSLLKDLKTAYVSDVVFFEFEHLARSYYMMSREMVQEHLRSMVDSSYFNFNKALWSEILKIYLQHQGLSMADCYLVLSARERGHESFVTFDRSLARKLPKFVELA